MFTYIHKQKHNEKSSYKAYTFLIKYKSRKNIILSLQRKSIQKLFFSGRGINKFQKFNAYYGNLKVHPDQIFRNKENQEYKRVIKITHFLPELQKGVTTSNLLSDQSHDFSWNVRWCYALVGRTPSEWTQSLQASCQDLIKSTVMHKYVENSSHKFTIAHTEDQ